MAKMKLIHASDARGKIAGGVFSKNRSGNYLRAKVTPVNPSTSFQSVARAALTALSQAWRSLSASARTSWNNAVQNFPRTNIFGDQVLPTGKNLYTALNRNLQLVGVANISTPPAPTAVESVNTLSAVADESSNNLVLTFSPGTVPADTAFLIEATPNVSAGVSNANNKFRVIDYADAASTSPKTITTNYSSKLGNMTTGMKVFVKMTPINKVTGQRGISMLTSAIVQA